MKLLRVLLLSCSLTSVVAIGAPEVRVATFADYPPFCFYAPGADTEQYQEVLAPGQQSRLFTGLAWEVVINSFHQMGYQVHLTIVPWPRALQMLDAGLVDAVFPAVQNQQRRQRYLFSEKLVYPENSRLIYSRADDQSIDGLASLNDQRVAIIREFSYGSVWEQFQSSHDLNLTEVNNVEQGFDLLENDRVDALVGYELSHDYHLRRLKKQGLFRKTDAFDSSYSFLMGRAGAEVIINDYDRGWQSYQRSGGYQRLLQKWNMD